MWVANVFFITNLHLGTTSILFMGRGGGQRVHLLVHNPNSNPAKVYLQFIRENVVSQRTQLNKKRPGEPK